MGSNISEKKITAIQNKLEELQRSLNQSHAEHFNWANTIHQRQIRLEKILGVQDRDEPFEPFYLRNLDISPAYPEIFNKYGEKMEVFFISDREFAHVPNDQSSRYVIWDRFNYGLKTHFYTHDEVFKIVGKPERKFAVLLEPRTIKSQSYQNFLQNKEYIENNFDAVFTFDSEILSTFKNAKFADVMASVWYGRNLEGVMFEGAKEGFSSDGSQKENVISSDNYKRKNKNISMVSSAKEFCPLHVLRKNLAMKFKNMRGGVNTFGTFDGGNYASVKSYLESYRYSIVLENYIDSFYFTEKILNCFAAETIPIYLGATEIDKFFNPDGIIKISVDDCDNIEKILEKCTVEEYEKRLPAIIDNFQRAQEYIKFTPWDRIYLKYLK